MSVDPLEKGARSSATGCVCCWVMLPVAFVCATNTHTHTHMCARTLRAAFLGFACASCASPFRLSLGCYLSLVVVLAVLDWKGQLLLCCALTPRPCLVLLVWFVKRWCCRGAPSHSLLVRIHPCACGGGGGGGVCAHVRWCMFLLVYWNALQL